MRVKAIRLFIISFVIIILQGCAFTDSEHILGLENKNESLYSLFSDAETYIRVDKNNPRYEIFKNSFIGSDNYASSHLVYKCLTPVTFPFERASKNNELHKFINCVGEDKIELNSKSEIKYGGVLANKAKLDIAKQACSYMKSMNLDLDYNECVLKHYKPTKSTVNKSINGATVRVYEDDVYGIIKIDIARKSRVTANQGLHDLFTEERIALIESDENYADILIYARGHHSLENTLYGHKQNRRIRDSFIDTLKLLNIDYQVIRW